MPRDQRLFMTFPIDFDEHPKVAALSDAAFRAFVEMNAYSRRNDLDGVIPAAAARRRWRPRSLTELTRSHPERPLVIFADDAYVLRSYGDHQQTKADRESLSSKRADAGRKGAASRWGGSKPMASARQTDGNEKAESRVQSLEGLTTHVSESQSLLKRAREMTDSISPVIQGMASRAGITDLASLIVAIHEHTGCLVEPAYAVALTNELVGRAKGAVKNPQRYVVSCLAQSPGEIQQHIYEAGWAA